MNILLITWNYPPKVGGMENMISQLVKQWLKSSTVTVIGPKGLKQTSCDDVIRPKRDGILWFIGSAFFHSIRILRSRNFDIIITGSALVAPLAVVLGIFFRCPVASLIHGLDLLYRQPLYQLTIKYFLPRCSILFANSHNTKELAITRGVSPERIDVINPGLDLNEFLYSDRNQQQYYKNCFGTRRIILSAGRLVARKGIPEFIENVIPQILKSDPEILLIIVGENPIQSLAHKEDIKGRILEIVDKNNLSQNVLLMGHVNRSELIQLYSMADIFVLPAIAVPNDVEGFGIVILEAGAVGCPIVATRIGGIPDAVADGMTGILVEPGDWQSMTTTMIRLLNNQSLRRELGENGRKRVKEFFDWPVVGERYLLSISKILSCYN